MVDIDKLLQKEVEKATSLKIRLEYYKENCPCILAVLNSNPMTAHKYFDVDLDDLNSVDMFCSYMYHAMIDDGDYSVVREVNVPLTDMHKRYAHIHQRKDPEYVPEIVYNYEVKGGDWSSRCPAARLDAHDIEEICRLDAEHYDFYEEHKKEIEMRGRLPESNSARNRYYELSRLAESYLEGLWKKNYEKNRGFYEGVE